MNPELIFCCELTDVSSHPDATTEFLSVYEYDFSSFIDSEENSTRHTLYFDNIESADLAAENLAKIPPEWLASGLKFTNIRIFPLKQEEWSEVWKKHFKIQHVTDKITIKPTWLEYKQKCDDEVILEIDPGMSFGTGRHATTRFCLKMLAEIPEREKLSFFDAGCGSGILTIAAHKLGFKQIAAFDHDSDCIKCTKENLQVNKIDFAKFDLFTADIADLAENKKHHHVYDVVVANILAHILFENCKTIKSFMKPDARLILAGILTEEYPAIRDTFIEIGLREIKKLAEDEWTGGVFVFS